MFTLTSELLLTLFASSWIFVLCQETQEVTVKAGEDATLQCYGGVNISLIAWSRTDLTDDGYVFFFSDSRSWEDEQHPSFHGRVNLSDPEMTDGDASVILMNVQTTDNGTYECSTGEKNKKKQEKLMIIRLTVTVSGFLCAPQVIRQGDKRSASKRQALNGE
ncbi:V-set domain-containing T-cell activation inhibitor 1-like [Micropterus salmoides]|uniref:V-set domain-containing T-cell activation inhibitor 1-like n=1 Tax=Micropterus salmoides TaxID=27706 RepID=UPI0018EE3173|nr:V-set domain-containing T-cell activation inhibitor 1-like [Micropterus salmoides]